ncbi:hypothetical protein HDR61_00515 [bacterium]|nr:hypothetical protein [bacterium]
MKKKAINETAARVGHALRTARQTARLTHGDSADLFGITMEEQLQYERGTAQIPIELLEHMFVMGYKLIGIRILEKKYRIKRDFIRKIKQTIKEGI